MSPTSMAERVLAVLDAAAGRPLKAKDVSKAISLSSDDRGDIRQVLFDLVDDGRAVQLPGRRFVSAKAERPEAGVKGVIQRKPGGSVWFVPHERARKDAFVPPQESRSVVDGDVVLARIDRAPKGPIATIIKTLEHSTRPITGTLHVSQDRRSGKSRYVEVDDNVLAGAVRIVDDKDRAKDGDVVVVELTKPPTSTTAAEGRIVQRLGERGGLDVEIERLVHQAGVVRAFPDVVVAEAGSFGDVPVEADFAGREDLRDLAIVTIDGETAKDFDDAVYATRGKAKKIDVVVCVADVSHYVTLGSDLDDEALRRGTSIYYPGRGPVQRPLLAAPPGAAFVHGGALQRRRARRRARRTPELWRHEESGAPDLFDGAALLGRGRRQGEALCPAATARRGHQEHR